MKSFIATTLCGAAFLIAASVPAGAQPAQDKTPDAKPFTWTKDVQVVSGGDLQQVRNDSDFNPQNHIAGLADGQASTELRPDFTLGYRRFSFEFGPRLLLGVTNASDQPGHEGNARGFADFYVNRWRVKAQLAPTLSVSYGREALQWGNSVFRSPSNPFYADNGRLNPIRELPGQDFAVITYTPSQSYAVSLVSNTGAGHAATPGVPFHVTNAIKFDYVGKALNAVIIASKQQGRSLRLGGSYTYTASDALLVYGEMTATRGSSAYYPEPGSNAAGWQLAPVYERSGRLFYTNLVGGAYTLPGGLTITAEYLHSNEGYTKAQARQFSSLSESASALFDRGGPGAALGAQLLGQSLNTGLRVERQNYIFVQALVAEYRKRADISLSYAANLDTGGGMVAAYATWSLNPRTKFFAVGSYNVGSVRTEFARLQRSTLSTGVWFFF